MFSVRIKSYEPDCCATYFEFTGRLTSRKYNIILEEMQEICRTYSDYVIADIYPQTTIDEVVRKCSWDEGRHFIEMRKVIDDADVINLSVDVNYIKSFHRH